MSLDNVIEKTQRRTQAVDRIVNYLSDRFDAKHQLIILSSYFSVDRLEEIASQLEPSNQGIANA